MTADPAQSAIRGTQDGPRGSSPPRDPSAKPSAASREHAIDSQSHDITARARLTLALVKRRMKRGISQRRVAARMHTTQSAVSDLEKGLVDPRLSTLQRYARAIDCRLDFSVVEDDGQQLDSHVWTSTVIFTSWKNRSLPYKVDSVSVTRKPAKVLERALRDGRPQQHYPALTHSRNPYVRETRVTETPDAFLSSVRRG
ncbi:helix-turn-helix transcriptional regulator [Micromonospora sp. NPDC002717]|uniref:helix-turn-helix domain-containing protein n=1 Tax=Micromonospora sp. NPDC002717 TaxID=3154424 RepID=UPI00331A31AA